MAIKRLYDESGSWLEDKEVKDVALKTSKKVKAILKDLFDAGWSRIDVERMMFDNVRYESTMLSLLRQCEISEKEGKRLIRKSKST